MDDALALAVALTQPCTIDTIVASSGNVPVSHAVDNTARLLHVAGHTDSTLVRGSASPLSRRRDPWQDRVWGWQDHPGTLEGWAAFHNQVLALDSTRPPTRAKELAAAVAAASTRNAPLVLVGLAPLTDVALALASSAQFAARINRIVLMGGAINLPNEYREFNFAADAMAASAVLRAGIPLTIVPLDVTRGISISTDALARIHPEATPLGKYIIDGTRPWLSLDPPICWLRGWDLCRGGAGIAVALFAAC